MVKGCVVLLAQGRAGEQHGVCGDGTSGYVLNGGGGADLGIADAQECFFVPEVDLDVPAPQVVLHDLGEVCFGVGADEVGGFSVQQLSAFTQAVGRGGEHE